MLQRDTSIEAEYADGYIHSETENNDVSPYDPKFNIFNDILEKRPEAEHGRMVRFSCFYQNNKYSVDWNKLPDNARPIRFRDASSSTTGGVTTFNGYHGVRFGYQFNDANGRNVQEVSEL
jgi:hypothetical protein